MIYLRYLILRDWLRGEVSARQVIERIRWGK